MSGCQSNSTNNYKNFLSDEKDTLSILVIDEDLENFTLEELEDEGITNIITKVHQTTSLDNFQNKYSDLEVKQIPAYIVFDTKDMILKTYKRHELIDFLKKYKGNSQKQ